VSEPGTRITVPDGAVIITPQAQYQELVELRRSVDKLTTVVDPALTELRGHVQDHEGRIRALEKRVWQALGACVVLSPGVGMLTNILLK